jgi:hypothetical protein
MLLDYNKYTASTDCPQLCCDLHLGTIFMQIMYCNKVLLVLFCSSFAYLCPFANQILHQ